VRVFVVRGRPLAEEVVILRHHNVLVEPPRLLEQALVRLEDRLDTDVLEALVEPVPQERRPAPGKEVQLALVEDPVQYLHLCLERLLTGRLDLFFEVLVEEVRILSSRITSTSSTPNSP